MKKLLLVGALALGGLSCAPDIKQDPPADNVVAQFDPVASPAVVPLPTDLVFNSATQLVAAPIDPEAPAAQQEFTRDYLNTLNGFPTSVVATTKITDLDPSTINPDTVRFIDLLKGTPIATANVEVDTKYDAATGTLSISSKNPAGWPKGGRYAIALVGGEGGLKGTNGKPVVGSAVWGFASSVNPLVTCEDLTAPDCRTTTEIIPSAETEPAAKLADQTASALRLEQLRRAYRPVLDAIATQGVEREDIVLLWTFRIMNMPEATFDPAAGVVPFPNDILLDPTTKKVKLPVPAGASPLQQQLIAGLNTLDGFSTTAAIVSENGDTRGPIDTGSRLDQNSLATGTLFIKLTPGGTAPNVTACLNCVSSNPTSTTNPQQLQFVPQVPLDEKSQYAAVMTSNLKDERGRKVAPAGAFALVRLSASLVQDGKSQVSGVSDANANALEPLRAGLKPLFDGLEAKGIKRSQVVLAWAFTTQSINSVLAQLHALPAASYGPAGLPAAAAYVEDDTTDLIGIMNGNTPQLPTAGLGKILKGNLYAPFALTGPSGTLNPTQPRFDRIAFLLSTPSSAMPAEGYPVAVFSHGLSGSHLDGLRMASALASQGYAMISIDTAFHGERSSCVGTAALLGQASDDAACANPAAQRCETTLSAATAATYGRCVARDPDAAVACDPAPTAAVPGDLTCSSASPSQGRCLPTGKCEGGDFLRAAAGRAPVISGANFLNVSNLFATRDNFRQHAIDLGQLVRVVNSNEIDAQIAGASGTAGLKLDGTKIVYVGQSLGGILGTLSTSVAPGVGNVVLNVPGGNLTGILLTSPATAFVQARTGLINTLAASGINAGTPAFDQFLGLSKMILDPADPVNYAYHVENGTVPPTREALIQYVTGDEVIPNPTTQALINAANNRDASKKKLATSVADPAGMTDRHGLLLNFRDRTDTEAAQSEAVQFLKTGVSP